MKRISAFLFLFAMHGIAYSQKQPAADISVCTILNNICSMDLTDPIPGLVLDSVSNISYGIPGVSKDVLYSETQCYGSGNRKNVCKDGFPSLNYNVYYPESINGSTIDYSQCGFPAIIMFHGGGYDECSDKSNPGIVDVCRELAKRGFVVFNVEYRRGVLVDSRRSLEVTSKYRYISAQQILAIYTACQDVRGAIRTIIYKQRTNNNGARFKIDDSKLFLGGISAGSMAVMNAAYSERQGQIDSSWSNASAVLGDIDAPYYVGDTSINFIPSIKGVLDMWGAIQMSISLKGDPGSFFNGNTGNAPLIAFQGSADDIFPSDTTSVYFSPDSSRSKKTNYNSVSNCLLKRSAFTLDNVDHTPDAYAIGAESIYKAFKEKKIPVEIYMDCTMEHGMDTCKTGGRPCVFDSDFGTGYKDQNAVYSYIAARTATFFFTVLSNNANLLSRSRFVECRNYRKICDMADADACSYPTTQQASYSCKDFFKVN
ncbi:MAG: alpha/beta hydrolase [Panacibacter sp.]